MRYAFVHEHREDYPLERLCRVLEVSRSGYYAWRGRPKSERAKRDEALTETIKEVHAESRNTYGSPRVHVELRARGVGCSRKRVARLMRLSSLRARCKRKWRVTTNSRHTLPVAENVLERDFAVERPNEVWAADITYIPTLEGWLYLAVVLDLYSRRVVGWAMGEEIMTELPLRALRMAAAQRQPSPGLVHHSDRGSQYASHAYQAALEGIGAVPSMSRRGDCWDNAVVESFFATLKTEEVDGKAYRTRDEARSSVFGYIEGFYNRRRRHSTLRFESPQRFEELRLAA